MMHLDSLHEESGIIWKLQDYGWLVVLGLFQDDTSLGFVLVVCLHWLILVITVHRHFPCSGFHRLGTALARDRIHTSDKM